MTSSKTQAIQTALTGNWNDAVSLNKALLKENPDDIETLNRLAFAFSVIGRVKDAKSIYRKVLELDSQNPIALKNLKRLSASDNKNKTKKDQNNSFLCDIDTMFLEENGKTKVIELINVAEPKIISNLMTGELLSLHIKRLKIFVLDGKQRYVGMLPEDVGKRLIKFLKGGNNYQVCVKSITNRHLAIFIKEIKRSARFKNQASFVSSENAKPIIIKNYANREHDLEDHEIDDKEE